jgi:hypothetical protein
MAADSKRLSVMGVGVSLGLFLAISFVLCIALALIVPDAGLHRPWHSWLTWPSFFLGLCESFAYGLYAGIVFVPLYNFFARVGADWW